MQKHVSDLCNGRTSSQSESSCLAETPSIIFDDYLLLNVQLVKLKVFYSEEMNQEEETEAPVILSCCGWPQLS